MTLLAVGNCLGIAGDGCIDRFAAANSAVHFSGVQAKFSVENCVQLIFDSDILPGDWLVHLTPVWGLSWNRSHMQMLRDAGLNSN